MYGSPNHLPFSTHFATKGYRQSVEVSVMRSLTMCSLFCLDGQAHYWLGQNTKLLGRSVTSYSRTVSVQMWAFIAANAHACFPCSQSYVFMPTHGLKKGIRKISVWITTEAHQSQIFLTRDSNFPAEPDRSVHKLLS